MSLEKPSFRKKMFTIGQNIDFPQWSRVDKAVLRVETHWLSSKKKKKFWAQYSVKKVKLTTVKNVSYC